MRRQLLIALTLACTQYACKDPLGSGSGSNSKRKPINLTTQLGALISDSINENVWGAWWSPDGQRLYYQAVTPSGTAGLVGVNVATGARWTVTSGRQVQQGPTLSADGAFLFFVASDSSSAALRLYRVPATGGSPQFVLDSVCVAWVTPDVQRLLYAPWPCLAANYTEKWVYDAGSGARRRLGAGDLAAFSPDGRMVLLDQGAGNYLAASLADTTTSRISSGLSLAWNHALRWGADGIWVLFVMAYPDSDEFRARNLTTGEDRLIYVEAYDGTVQLVTWSCDGSRMAFWVSYCEAGSLFGCNRTHAALYTVDVGQKKESWLAGAEGYPYPPSIMLLAPDQKRILYAFTVSPSVGSSLPTTLRLSVVP